jgi:hypothetical protein
VCAQGEKGVIVPLQSFFDPLNVTPVDPRETIIMTIAPMSPPMRNGFLKFSLGGAQPSPPLPVESSAAAAVTTLSTEDPLTPLRNRFTTTTPVAQSSVEMVVDYFDAQPQQHLSGSEEEEGAAHRRRRTRTEDPTTAAAETMTRPAAAPVRIASLSLELGNRTSVVERVQCMVHGAAEDIAQGWLLSGDGAQGCVSAIPQVATRLMDLLIHVRPPRVRERALMAFVFAMDDRWSPHIAAGEEGCRAPDAEAAPLPVSSMEATRPGGETTNGPEGHRSSPPLEPTELPIRSHSPTRTVECAWQLHKLIPS